MKKEMISDIITGIDDRFVVQAATETFEPNRITFSKIMTNRIWKRGLIAACVTAVILAGSGAGAYAVEASKLHAATAFFDEYGLSMEGLSNSEVKAVYRDISQSQFTYDKTAAVMQGVAPGFETGREKMTPEELAVVWDSCSGRNALPQTGIGYRKGYQYTLDKKLGFNVLKKSVLACYRDGEFIWSAEFPEFYVEDSLLTENGTIVWGRSYTWSEEQRVIAWVALVDDEGKTLWKYNMDHGFRQETIVSVLDNGDGTFAVISRREPSRICLAQWDKNGIEDIKSSIEIGGFSIGFATRLGDGYLVQLQTPGNASLNSQVFARFDRNGAMLVEYFYEDEQFDYYYTDMEEYEGKIYISAYAVPYWETTFVRNQLISVLPKLYVGMSDEEVTAIVRANYTAVLLECDPVSGVPKTVCSVDGALSGALSADEDGRLYWDVENLESAYFTLEASSYCIGGTLEIYRYVFDGIGEPIDRQDIGKNEWRF